MLYFIGSILWSAYPPTTHIPVFLARGSCHHSVLSLQIELNSHESVPPLLASFAAVGKQNATMLGQSAPAVGNSVQNALIKINRVLNRRLFLTS